MKNIIFLLLVIFIEIKISFSNVIDNDSIARLITINKGNNKNLMMIYLETSCYLFDHNQAEKALPYIIVYENVANKSKDSYNKAYVDYLYGRYYFEKSKLAETIYKLNSSYDLIKDLNDSLSIRLKVKIHVAYSACYLDCGMLAEACENLQKGLEINKLSSGDLRNEITIKHNLAILYTYLEQYDNAIRINWQNIDNPFIMKDILFTTYYNLSYNYLKLSKPDSALYCIDRANENVSIDKEKMMYYLRKGDIFLYNNDNTEAEDYYHKALNIIGNNKNDYIGSYAIIMANMAKICYNSNRFDKALEYANILDTLNNLSNKVESLNIKIDILKYRGQYEDALSLMLKKEKIMDSISGKKNIDKTNQYLMQYKIKEIENEYVNQKEIAQLKHSRVIIVLISLIILLAGIVIVVILLLNRKKIMLHNKQLNEKAMTNELETRNREIASNVITMMKKNEIYAEMVKKLAKVKDNAVKDETKTAITGIIKDIEKTIESNINEEFVIRFQQVHSEFYNNLLDRYPNLTANEIRLCAYLKLNLNTKEIIALTGQTERSIIIARYRLRRKLGLEAGDNSNLSTFISNI